MSWPRFSSQTLSQSDACSWSPVTLISAKSAPSARPLAPFRSGVSTSSRKVLKSPEPVLSLRARYQRIGSLENPRTIMW